MQVHVHYWHITMSLTLYIPCKELQLKLCTQMGVVHYCENVHLLRHRSEHTCTSTIYYQVDSVTKALHHKAKYAINLNLDPTVTDKGDLTPLSNVPNAWTLVCAQRK